MRIGWRSGLASLSSPRQKLTQQYKHALQGYHFTRCPTTPRMMHSIESINKSTPRRFLTTGGVKSPKVKSNSTKEAVKSGTKESTSTPPPSSFPQFWKSYLQPKPMPERWSAAWYREMVLVCTVFAITGSSTMVLVSQSEDGKNGQREHIRICCDASHNRENKFSLNSHPFVLQLQMFNPIIHQWHRFAQQFRTDWALKGV